MSGAGATLMDFLRAIARNDRARVSALLAGTPELALARLEVGATRHDAQEYFLDEIDHHMYAGDTALHVAAAAYQATVARELVAAGAAIAAEDRRGAQPLHYAVDGIPGSARWDPVAQRDTIACLLEFGADPNACRRERDDPAAPCRAQPVAAAVEVLLGAGADPQATNRRGSTAMQLVGWTTGRGGTGSAAARTQQQEIIRLLQASCGV